MVSSVLLQHEPGSSELPLRDKSLSSQGDSDSEKMPCLSFSSSSEARRAKRHCPDLRVDTVMANKARTNWWTCSASSLDDLEDVNPCAPANSPVKASGPSEVLVLEDGKDGFDAEAARLLNITWTHQPEDEIAGFPGGLGYPVPYKSSGSHCSDSASSSLERRGSRGSARSNGSRKHHSDHVREVTVTFVSESTHVAQSAEICTTTPREATPCSTQSRLAPTNDPMTGDVEPWQMKPTSPSKVRDLAALFEEPSDSGMVMRPKTRKAAKPRPVLEPGVVAGLKRKFEFD